MGGELENLLVAGVWCCFDVCFLGNFPRGWWWLLLSLVLWLLLWCCLLWWLLSLVLFLFFDDDDDDDDDDDQWWYNPWQRWPRRTSKPGTIRSLRIHRLTPTASWLSIGFPKIFHHPEAEWFRKDGETNLPNSQKSHFGNGPTQKWTSILRIFCWEMVPFAICNEECTGLCRGFPTERNFSKWIIFSVVFL